MKKLKSILALLLVVALVCTLLAACSKTESNTGNSTSSSKVFSEGEIRNLKFVYFDLRMTGADHGPRIAAAINEHLEPTYGLHVDIDYFNIGDWMSKIMVALAGGERVDIMPYLFSTGVTNMVAQTMARPLDDLLNTYAPEAVEKMANYMDAFRIGGQLYGFPTYKNWVGNGYVVMRKDILEELGMVEKAQNLDSWSGLEEIFQAVTDKYAGTGMYASGHSENYSVLTGAGHLTHGDKWADMEVWDTLNDAVGVVYCADNKISLYQELDAYVDELKMVHSWSEKGYLWPDTAIDTTTHGDELMKQQVQFSSFSSSEIGIEVTKGASIGFELVCPMYRTGMITTSGVQTWGIGIPVTAEEPEAAAYFLNILYTDPVVMNLLTWGVEGEDYDVVDGQVKTREGQYYQADFLVGDNLLLMPIYGNGADHYDHVRQNIAEAALSPYLGFALDRSDLELQIANISAVNDQYTSTLYGGLYSDDVYNEYVAKLHTAGVDDCLNAVQAQLDAWLAAK